VPRSERNEPTDINKIYVRNKGLKYKRWLENWIE
jgi:hypothetical protein